MNIVHQGVSYPARALIGPASEASFVTARYRVGAVSAVSGEESVFLVHRFFSRKVFVTIYDCFDCIEDLWQFAGCSPVYGVDLLSENTSNRNMRNLQVRLSVTFRQIL